MTNIPWKEGGVYLITGGIGSLGRIFAQEILDRTTECSLILTGRRTFEEVEEKLNELNISDGQDVRYVSMNIENEDDTVQLINDVMDNFGKINGIIHTAGVIIDSYIIQKNNDNFRKVLYPKVNGVKNLDEATKNISLDFIVFFASTAGLLGNSGQSDYAIANSYMDEFAKKRNRKVENGERSGKTLSMDWSFWKNGGMTMVDYKVELLKQNFGIAPLETNDGINAFYIGINSEQSQVGVFCGDLEKIKNEIL
jgi:NADP-dependent 3-hydroxy acid dehydrogenase YdfG